MILELKQNLVDKIGRYASLKKVAAHEWAGPCPKCGGRDRFRVNDERGWFCRTCQGTPGDGAGHWGDYADFMQFLSGWSFQQTLHSLGMDRRLTPIEIAKLDEERKAAQDKARQEERTKQIEVHKHLTDSGDWLRYHQHQGELGRELWHNRGIPDSLINFYRLGFCRMRDWWGKFTCNSLTIPYLRMEGETIRVINLKHRLLMDNPPMGKYLPDRAGAGNHLFFTNYPDPDPTGKNLLIIEGEIKSIISWSAIVDTGEWPCWTVIGIPGHGWREEWIETFNKAERVYICLDPDNDAQKAAKRLVNILDGKARNILLPDKIDDLITMGVLDGPKLLELLEA